MAYMIVDDESFHETPPELMFDLNWKKSEQTDHLNDESFNENHKVKTSHEHDEFDKSIRKN